MYIHSLDENHNISRKLSFHDPPLSLFPSLVSSLPSSIPRISCQYFEQLFLLPGGTSCRLFPREGVKSRNVTDEPSYYQFEVKRKRGATAGNAHGWQ